MGERGFTVMNLLKRSLFALLLGAVVGDALTTLVSAKFITWYNQPGGGQAALCPCEALSTGVVSQLIEYQLIGAAVGALVFLVLMLVFFRGPKHPKPEAALPAASPASSSTPSSGA